MGDVHSVTKVRLMTLYGWRARILGWGMYTLVDPQRHPTTQRLSEHALVFPDGIEEEEGEGKMTETFHRALRRELQEGCCRRFNVWFYFQCSCLGLQWNISGRWRRHGASERRFNLVMAQGSDDKEIVEMRQQLPEDEWDEEEDDE
jgi:hypothetical protein